MRTSTRLGLYGGGLALLFAAAFGAASALIPGSVVEAWNDEADDTHGHEGHGDTVLGGLAIEQDGYRLGEIAAPETTGVEGTLAFTITGPDGEPLTEYAVSHEKELHLIVVRSDGTGFRHVHPARDEDGVWSLPWTWDAAGSYRVYTDFVPADPGTGTGTESASGVTLTRTVEVAGTYDLENPAEPVIPAGTSRITEVDGYTVALEGDFTAGTTAELTIAVTRDREPVTTLEPYLGAFGHLVALREGDLAYLHVHPEGDAPAPEDRSGPHIEFAAEFPTEGRYFLYLDFQVDGQVRTAAFAVEAVENADGSESEDGTGHDEPGHGTGHDEPGHSTGDDDTGHDHGHGYRSGTAADGHGR